MMKHGPAGPHETIQGTWSGDWLAIDAAGNGHKSPVTMTLSAPNLGPEYIGQFFGTLTYPAGSTNPVTGYAEDNKEVTFAMLAAGIDYKNSIYSFKGRWAGKQIRGVMSKWAPVAPPEVQVLTGTLTLVKQP